ncbi:MAG: hypothetical protein H0X24_25550, partial [Ktedonobacterales bacterium]|nr:hypothetical protein [Ktedonobacterales bacterium]
VATHRSAMMDRLRFINKRTYNRLTLTVAGRPGSGYAVIYHTGRKSGKTYATPIVAETTPTGFLIPLPYGSETDWCLNVRQAEGAVLKKLGTTYCISQPEVVNDGFAKPLLSSRAHRMLRFFGVREFLHVRAAALPEIAEIPSVQRQSVPV